MSNGIKRVSIVLMAIGFLLIACGGGVAFLFNSNQSWMIVGGWSIGIIGVGIYAYCIVKHLKHV